MLAWDVWVVVLMVAWDVWVVLWVDAWDGWAVVWAAAWDVWVVVVSWVDASDGWVVVRVEAWDVKVVGSILMCPRFLGRVMESVLLWLPLGGMCVGGDGSSFTGSDADGAGAGLALVDGRGLLGGPLNGGSQARLGMGTGLQNG